MKWYIVFFGSTDYYTSYDGYEIVKANTSELAVEKAIKKNYPLGMSKHCSVEYVIECGIEKPKVTRWMMR